MAIRAKTTIKTKDPKIRYRMAQALELYRQAIDPVFKAEIKAVQFDWPGTTIRSNGQVVGSPRDIVDTGAFLASQRSKAAATGKSYTVSFQWGGTAGVTYAGIILTGQRGNLDGYPGRDWIKPAIIKNPYQPFMQQTTAKLFALNI